MNKKKIFGIGAVAILLIVAIAPAINGANVNNKEKKQELLVGKPFKGEITKCQFIEYKLNRAIYEISWNVVKLGDPLTPTGGDIILKVNDRVFDSWNFHIPCMGTHTSGIRKISIKTSDLPSIDEERYFAGKIALGEFHLAGSGVLIDTSYVFVKHWKDEEEYVPTEPQIEVGAPHWYNKIYCVPDIPELFKLDLFDARILPNVLKSERMGWFGELAIHLANISSDIAVILGLTVAFLLSIKDELIIIGQWLMDMIICIETAVNGIYYGCFLDLFNDFIYHVIPAISSIIVKAGIWGAEIIKKCNDLYDHINEFYNWTLLESWLNPINLKVRVDHVAPGEIVTISCRGYSNEIRDYDGDGTVYYETEVTSEPLGEEKSHSSPHLCQVTVEGTEHKGNSVSQKILSWAFSNGMLYWHFVYPGDPKNKDISKEVIVDKLKEIIENRPILNIFKNILEKIINKNKECKRDFDLDSLVNNAREEQIEYVGYDLELKEYYKGAPHDPNIVYYASDQVVVGFKSYVNVENIEQVKGYPVVDKLVELNVVIVEIYGVSPEDFIEMVQEINDVEYAELNYIYEKCFEPNDPLWKEQWGPKAIKCPEAWDAINREGAFSHVVIIDTGCNNCHEDITSSVSDIDYDFVNDDLTPDDDCYVKHGTHCAGIIGAIQNNGKGISGVVGRENTGYDVCKSYIKVLDSQGIGYSSTIAKGITHAVKYEDYVDVISMSLGGYGLSLLMHVACDYAYYIRGAVIVAAAGNDGLKKMSIPARFSSVISVGAVDENLELCSWSNYGPNLDIVAPGEDIISTYKTSGSNMYKKLSGTSMACPHVAGVAALYLAGHPYASANICKGKLFSTAIPLSNCGHGLVNAYGVVKNSKERNRGQILSEKFPLIKHFLNSLKK